MTEIEHRNIRKSAFIDAVNSFNKCNYPGCHSQAINSHLLQKNGVLKPLIEDSHVMEMTIDEYNETPHRFHRTPIKKAFSFKCFCKDHDNNLFKPIESEHINFSSYKNKLLFLVRAKLNEIQRKKILVERNRKLISLLDNNRGEQSLVKHYEEENFYLELAIEEMSDTLNKIWNDLNNGTESFKILQRNIDQVPLALSSFYTYETSEEMGLYRFKYGKEMPKTTSIFISIFPYESDSIVLIALEKANSSSLNQYLDELIYESNELFYKRITNLILFHCETFIVSEKFYLDRILPCQHHFNSAVEFSYNLINERQVFDINIFASDFCSKADSVLKNVRR